MSMVSDRDGKFHHKADLTRVGEAYRPGAARSIAKPGENRLGSAPKSRRVGSPLIWRLYKGDPSEAGIQRKSGRSERVAGPILAVCAVAVAMVALAHRDQLVGAAPVLSGVFREIGAPASGDGLAVEDLKARLGGGGERNLLLVEGTVVNRRAVEIASPELRIALRDANGEERYVWTTRVAQTRLTPAERVKFSARLEAPPAGVVDATVKVARAAERTGGRPEGL